MWFTKIYIDTIPDEPHEPLRATPERTVIADALEASRQVIVAEL
jgi:hypothetical protein